MKNRPSAIYLDHHATTPTDPRVVDAMLPYFTERFGNPHSSDHAFGWEAADAVEEARAQIARLIGGKAKDLIFTSGATEANNLAIKGAARARRKSEGALRVVTAATEHACVLESARALEREGFELVILPVDGDGLVDLDALAGAVDGRTAIVSVMLANNEIGTIQPLEKISAICREHSVPLHTDAAQAAGKITVDVRELGVDLMSLSAHKMYGPKGIGALYIRNRAKAGLEPLFDGGGQEKGIRSGTLAPPLCVGFGKAAELAMNGLADEACRVASLRDRMIGMLREGIEGASFNGHPEYHLPNNISINIDGMEASELLASLDTVAVSTGSACSSGGHGFSHVLRATGHDPAKVSTTLRIGLGRFTTPEEIEVASKAIVDAVGRLRARTSP